MFSIRIKFGALISCAWILSMLLLPGSAMARITEGSATRPSASQPLPQLVLRSLRISSRSRGYHVNALLKRVTLGNGHAASWVWPAHSDVAPSKHMIRQETRVGKLDWIISHKSPWFVQLIVGSRAASGPAGGPWTCQPLGTDLWADPGFIALSLQSPTANLPLPGHFSNPTPASVYGIRMWRVVERAASHSEGVTTKSTVTLLISRNTDLLRKMKVVSIDSVGGARRDESIDTQLFSRYGENVIVRLPAKCRAH